MARKYWLEVYHSGQRKPSLRDITGASEDEVRRTVEGLDEMGIAWAYGSGERMPDAIEWFVPLNAAKGGKYNA